VVRNIGGRTFYQQGRQWMDSRYQSGQQVITVQAFSDAHFACCAGVLSCGSTCRWARRCWCSWSA